MDRSRDVYVISVSNRASGEIKAYKAGSGDKILDESLDAGEIVNLIQGLWPALVRSLIPQPPDEKVLLHERIRGNLRKS